MEAANQPASGERVADVVDARPGGLRARRVRRHQEDARDDLDRERDRQRAPEDVRPARAADDGLLQSFVKKPMVADSLVEPEIELLDFPLLGAAHAIASRSGIPIRNL